MIEVAAIQITFRDFHIYNWATPQVPTDRNVMDMVIDPQWIRPFPRLPFYRTIGYHFRC